MALGLLENSIAVFISVFALSIGIAAIAIGAAGLDVQCSAPLAAYLVDVGGIMLGFGIASRCTYNCLVMLTNPLDAGDAMGAGGLLMFGSGFMCLFGVVALGLVITVIVLTGLNGPYAWELSSNDASRNDYCDEKLTSGARGIVVALSVFLGLLVVSPVACICNTTSVSLFDKEAESERIMVMMKERAKETGIDLEEWDKTSGEATNPVDASSEDVGVAVRRTSFEMA